MHHTTPFITARRQRPSSQRAPHQVTRSPSDVRPIRFTLSLRSIAVVLAAWLLATATHAQGYTNPAYGLTLTPPAGWVVDEEIDQAQNLFLRLGAPTQDAGIVINAEHLDAAVLTDGGIAHRNTVERDAFADIGNHIPGAEPTLDFFTDVGGVEAVGFDFETTDMYGTVLYAVHGGVIYRLAVFGTPAVIDAADDAFADVLDSIVFTTAGPANEHGAGTGGNNPLVTEQPDPWLGTFVGAQLTMTLQGGAGSYTGQIVFNGQTYPLRAHGDANQINGSFSSGGTEFAFTAVATGPQVTFATGGATYELRR